VCSHVQSCVFIGWLDVCHAILRCCQFTGESGRTRTAFPSEIIRMCEDILIIPGSIHEYGLYFVSLQLKVESRCKVDCAWKGFEGGIPGSGFWSCILAMEW
jgi:hypothetical protein